MEAVESLYSEFRAVDNLVARNTTRVLKAFQRARVGSHVSKKFIFVKRVFRLMTLKNYGGNWFLMLIHSFEVEELM